MSKSRIGLQAPHFGDLEENPLGSILNILFWNDPQRQIQTRVDNMEHTLLIGDYGTGWFRYNELWSNVPFMHRKDPDPGGCSSVSVRKREH